MAEQWRARNLPLGLAAVTVLAPIAVFFATFPGDDHNGFAGLPGTVRLVAIVSASVLAVAFIALSCMADREIVWGSGTLLLVLTTIAMFVSVFLRRDLENRAAWMFAGLSALCVVTLVLVAQDWARRQVVIAAGVAAFALGAFITRVGIENASIPPRWERVQIAAQAKAEQATLAAQFQQDAKDRSEALVAARTGLAALLSRTAPPLAVPDELRAQADTILRGANGSPAAVSPDDLQRFDAIVANQPAGSPPAVTTLVGAVHGLAAAVKAAGASLDSAALDRAICAVSGHQPVPASPTCDAASADPVTSHRSWLVAKHDLDVALAALRAGVTGGDADKAALEKLLAEVPRSDDTITVLSAVSNGPESVWRSAFHKSEPVLVPGPLGWVIIGALLFGLLTWLLKVNAKQLAGPVDVAPGDEVDKDLGKVLRVAVLQNVDEPGAAPGAPSANPVTTLLDIAGGPLSAVSKIVQAALTVVGRRYGYRVAIDVTTHDADKPAKDAATPTPKGAGESPAPARTTVLVRVSTMSDGATLASHVINDPSAEAAVRAAGLWAAGFILDRSSRIPSWAAWQPDTAHALAASKDEMSATLIALEQAVQEAPLSGLLLVLLGHHYELADRRVEAIDSYARAVATHPRYLVARYRLAVAVAMMRHEDKWPDKSPADRANDLRFLPAAVRAQHLDGGAELDALRGAAPLTDAPAKFTGLAVSLLNGLADDARYVYRAVNALRRSERDALWPGLVPGSRSVTARLEGLVRSAARSLQPTQLEQLAKDAADTRSWWQVSYNAACGYASRSTPLTDADAQKACGLLEQTLLRPGVHQLDAQWVLADPDLEGISAGDRFTNFVDQLRPGT